MRSAPARVIDRRILALAVPALGALAADPLLSLADTAIVARLGSEALAALGINGAIFGFAFLVFNFLAYVTTPVVARAVGAGQADEVAAVVTRALVLAVALGTGAAVLLIVAAHQLLDVMQTSEAIRGPALTYLRIRALAAPAVLVVLAGHGGFRGLGNTRPPLFVTVIVNLLNVGLDLVLIFGFGLGIAGSALGSVIAQYLGAAVLAWLLLARVGGFRLEHARWAGLSTLLRQGAWVTVRTFLLVFTLAAATAAAATLGVAELAAHQVLRETWFLSAMVVDGLAIAAQALVAEAGGRGDESGELLLIRRLLLWGVLVGLLFTGLWLLGRDLLAAAFSPSPAVAEQITTAVPMVGLFAVPSALLWVLDGIVLGQLRLRRMALSTAVGAALAFAVLWSLPAWGAGLSGVWLAVGAMILGRLGVLVGRGVKRPALRLG